MADTPVRTGYVEALAAWAPDAGFTGRLEVGAHPRENLAFFAALEGSTRSGVQALAGARLTF